MAEGLFRRSKAGTAAPEVRVAPDPDPVGAFQTLAERLAERTATSDICARVADAKLAGLEASLSERRRENQALREELSASLAEAGLLLLLKGQRDAADDRVRRARALDPASERTRSILAVAFFRLGHLHIARPYLLEAIARRPGDEQSHRDLAALYDWTGEPQKGEEVMRRFYAAHPLKHRAARPGPAPAKPKRVLQVHGLDAIRISGAEDDHGLLTSRPLASSFRPETYFDSARYDRSILTLLDGTPGREEMLPPADILINTMTDADLDGGALGWLAGVTAFRPRLPVINRPEAVMGTTRDAMAQYVADKAAATIRHPETVRLPRQERPADALIDAVDAADLGWPVLVREAAARPPGNLAKIADAAALKVYFEASQAEAFYLSRFEPHAQRPDALFPKYRMAVVGGTLYPVGLRLGEHWHVRFSDDLSLASRTAESLAEERAYLDGPAKALGATRFAALGRLLHNLDLDVFTADFTLIGDDDVFVFAITPGLKPMPSVRPSANSERALARIQRAFSTLIGRKISQG